MTKSPAVLLALAVLLAGCGKKESSSSSSESTPSQKTPEEAWKDARDAFLSKNPKSLLATLSAKSRKELIEQEGKANVDRIRAASDADLEKIAKSLGTTPRELKTSNAEEVVLLILKSLMNDEQERKKVEGTKWKEAKIDGDRAVAIVTRADGSEDRDALVKEDGTWKVDKGGSTEIPAGGGTPATASQKSPEEAWRVMVAAMRDRNPRALWNCLCAKSRHDLTEGKGAEDIAQLKALPDDRLAEAIKDWGVTPEQLRKLSNEEVMIASFTAMMKDEKERE